VGKKKLDPEARVRSNILPMNNALPDEFGMYWVTADEMHKRLILSGVHRSLSLEMVSRALANNNAYQEKVALWDYGGKIWYRSKLVHVLNGENKDVVPLDQRFQRKAGPQKRLESCINPPRHYFVGKGNRHFEEINVALEVIERKKEQDLEEAREREQEERRREQILEEERERLIE